MCVERQAKRRKAKKEACTHSRTHARTHANRDNVESPHPGPTGDLCSVYATETDRSRWRRRWPRANTSSISVAVRKDGIFFPVSASMFISLANAMLMPCMHRRPASRDACIIDNKTVSDSEHSMHRATAKQCHSWCIYAPAMHAAKASCSAAAGGPDRGNRTSGINACANRGNSRRANQRMRKSHRRHHARISCASSHLQSPRCLKGVEYSILHPPMLRRLRWVRNRPSPGSLPSPQAAVVSWSIESGSEAVQRSALEAICISEEMEYNVLYCAICIRTAGCPPCFGRQG